MKKITLSLLFGMISLIGFSQIGLVENFDTSVTLPAGWTSDAEDYAVSFVQNCDGRSVRSNFDDTNISGALFSPNVVGQSNGTDLTIAFDYKIVDWSAATDPTGPGWGEMYVQYSTDNGGNWTTVLTINDSNHVTSNTCANISATVPAASLPNGSDFRMRIETVWNLGNYYVYLDNISATQVVADPPECVNLITPADGSTGVGINTGLEWSAAAGIPTGYTLSVGTSPGGTDVVDNENVGLSTTYTFPADLEYGTTYYVTILPFNGNGPAIGCTEFTFMTGADPNAPVDCASGVPINEQYCYTDNETMSWNFQSSTGAPLVVFFNTGEIEECCDNINIYDGTDNTAPLLYSGNNDGDMTGFSEIAPSGFMYIEIESDGSVSCQSGFVPLDFDVSCVDETALPNCNASLTTPLNGATDVDVATQITWNPASVLVTGYFISIGTTTGGTDIVDNLDVGNVLSYAPGSLLPYESTIYVTITPYNDNGNAINCNENSFTTEINPYQCEAVDQCVFTFVLEDTFGDGWNGNTMTVSQDGLEIEVITLEGGTGPLELQIPLCDGIPFELYWNAGGAFANEVVVSVSNPFNDVIYTMPSGSGGLQDSLLFSDIVNCTPPTCPRPTDVTVGAINLTSVEVSWTETGTATTWEVIVQPLGTGYPDGTEPEIIQTTDNPYLYENLDPATQYEIYVRAICATDDFSDWEGPVAFDTTICDAADQCLFTFTLEDSFGDSWNGNTMTVSQNGIPLQILELTDGAGPLEIQVPLCDGLPFELFWNDGGAFANEVIISVTDAFDDEIFTMPQGSGALQGTLLFSSVVNCTPPTCPKPDDVTIVDVNPTSVEVSWTPGGAETTWQVIVQPLGTGYPTGTEPEIIETTDNPYLYENLDPGTEYEVYVLGLCAVDDLSDWEGPVSFKTPFLVDCEAGQVINTLYCYENGNNQYEEIFSFQSSSGFPLNLVFNSGEIEDCCDTIRILDGDGNIIYEGTNGGDLTGLSLTTPGDSFTIEVEADGSVSCGSGSETQWDFDVWCQTCIPQTVDFNVVNGDCFTDPDNPTFDVEVDISDMGDAASITITDNLGSPAQVATGTGIITFGPYPANVNVIMTAANTDDANCIVDSNALTFICAPPPNSCSIVYAGEDVDVDCSDPETDLTATYHLFGQDTNNYIINGLDACPLPPVMGGTPTSLEIDDLWSGVIDIGFEFCFFDGVYDQILIGSNGVLSFKLENANTGNGWQMDADDTLPNNTNPTLSEANIFGVAHDIDPSVCGDINYFVIGAAPYRMFVVNYTDVCHFSCNDLRSSSQIILYESSNNIDVNVFEKPTCSGWNDGNAVIGVQNNAGTVAFTPPNRNTGDWEVSADAPESYRFAPSQGAPNYTFEWLDEGGNVVGTTDTITVSPTETTTYTASVTYELCTGGTSTVVDQVVITNTGGNPIITDPSDMEVCDEDEDGFAEFDLTSQDSEIINDQTGLTVTYHISQDDADTGANPLASPYTNVTNPQEIFVRVEDDASGCISTTSFFLIVNPAPIAMQPNDLAECDDDDDGFMEFDLASQDTAIVGDQTDVVVTYHASEDDAENNVSPLSSPYLNVTNPQTIYVRVTDTMSGCFSMTNFDLIVGLIPETSFSSDADYEVCPNASEPIQVTATADNYSPSEVSIVWYEDGDVISGETGLTIPVLVAGYYEIEVTFIDTGCTSIAGVEVIESENCIIPQVITPNDDGFNDTFDLSSFDVESLIIYNRYGTKVFTKTDGYTNQFYGVAENGDVLPVGTYFYVMKYQEGKVRTSWLYINK